MTPLERTDKVLLEQVPKAAGGAVMAVVLAIGALFGVLPAVFGAVFLVFVCVMFPPLLLIVVPIGAYYAYALVRRKG